MNKCNHGGDLSECLCKTCIWDCPKCCDGISNNTCVVCVCGGYIEREVDEGG